MELSEVAHNSRLLEIGRKAVEDVLVDFRDSCIFFPLRNNGLVIRERDGRDSSVIRLGVEDAIRIGLEAIDKYLKCRKGGET